jgi:hypothetical protein
MALSPETQEFVAQQIELFDQNPLSPDCVFSDLYWWDTPDLDHPPADSREEALEASFKGVRQLMGTTVRNDGVLNLRDPTQPRATAIHADEGYAGMVVKIVREKLYRPSLVRNHPAVAQSIRGHVLGYSLTQLRGRVPVLYSREANWFMAAPVKKGFLAFFPLELDPKSSHRVGIESRYGASPKVHQVSPGKGVSEFVVGRAFTATNRAVDIYTRIVEAAIYQPVVPRRRFFPDQEGNTMRRKFS